MVSQPGRHRWRPLLSTPGLVLDRQRLLTRRVGALEADGHDGSVVRCPLSVVRGPVREPGRSLPTVSLRKS